MIETPTRIRCSSLSQYPDCGRRTAANLFRTEIEDAGYKLRQSGRGIGAAVGTAIHSAAQHMLTAKASTGELPPDSVITDIAVDGLKEQIRFGVDLDKITPSASEGHTQAARMALAYRYHIAPAVDPILIEERLEANFSDDIIVSGQPDTVGRERNRLRDLKGGARMGTHAGQVGGYSLILRAHNTNVQEASIDWVPRATVKKPQPRPIVQLYDIGLSETAAVNILRHIEDDLRVWRNGDPNRGVLPGDPWAFPANPRSMLCGPKYCSAWGTSFCREHAPEKDNDNG